MKKVLGLTIVGFGSSEQNFVYQSYELASAVLLEIRNPDINHCHQNGSSSSAQMKFPLVLSTRSIRGAIKIDFWKKLGIWPKKGGGGLTENFPKPNLHW